MPISSQSRKGRFRDYPLWSTKASAFGNADRLFGVDDIVRSRGETFGRVLETRSSISALDDHMLNAGYGAIGNKHFIYYKLVNAEAITLSGQLINKWTHVRINELLNKLLGTDPSINRTVAGDTDSVTGDTVIEINGEKITISDFYDACAETYAKYDSFNEDYVKTTTGCTTPSVGKNLELEYNAVNYVMKHKVKKRMFKITVAGESVVVTEDHSVMVIRDGELTSVKPANIVDSDEAVKIGDGLKLERYTDFEIEDLGVCEEYVYDIEVEGNHNFFGNGILVHNSLYLNMADVVKALKIDHLSDDEIADRLDAFMETVLSPQIDKFAEELCTYMNGVKNKMVWAREVISPIAVFVRKKGYTMRVIDSEGVRFKEPKFKVTGLEAVKASSYPAWARNFLRECYKIALERDQDKLHKRVKEIRKEFMAMSINDIAIPRGVNNLAKYSDSHTIYKKGTPKQVKAALIHNDLVKKRGLNVPAITEASKIKFIDLRRPNPINQDVIGFSWFLPKEFEIDNYIDRDSIYDVAFLKPLQTFLNAIKWTPEPIVSLEDFFN